MAQNNQPFKRPNLSENEEYHKIPPPAGQRGAGSKVNTQPGVGNIPGQDSAPQVNAPTQDEINWAIQLEDNVQKKGYKPNEIEMARYQDIANRIVMFQQAQAQAQKHIQQTQNIPVTNVVYKKKSKFVFFLKMMTFMILAIAFWAKISIIVLEPSYFTPRGKIYLVVKPVNFSDMYYSLNMDKIYDDKLKKGFTKDDLNLQKKTSKNSKTKPKINPKWYIDPQYWENNYILSMPYIKMDMNF